MRDRADHYAESERLLAEVKDRSTVWADGSRQLILLAALTHAVLASAPVEVIEKIRTADKAQHLAGIVDDR